MLGFVNPLHLPKFLLRAVVVGSGIKPSEGVIRNARYKAGNNENDFMINWARFCLFDSI